MGSLLNVLPKYLHKCAKKEKKRRNNQQNTSFRFPEETILVNPPYLKIYYCNISHGFIKELESKVKRCFPGKNEKYLKLCNEKEFLDKRRVLKSKYDYCYIFDSSSLFWENKYSDLFYYCRLSNTYYFSAILETSTQRKPIRIYIVSPYISDQKEQTIVTEPYRLPDRRELLIFPNTGTDPVLFETNPPIINGEGIDREENIFKGMFMEADEPWDTIGEDLFDKQIAEEINKPFSSDKTYKLLVPLKFGSIIGGGEVDISVQINCNSGTRFPSRGLKLKEKQNYGNDFCKAENEDTTFKKEKIKVPSETFVREIALKKIDRILRSGLLYRYSSYNEQWVDIKEGKKYLIKILITQLNPLTDLVRVTNETRTKIVFLNETIISSFPEFIGYSKQIQKVTTNLIYPFLYPEVYSHYQITLPSGIIFHGPPGTGKTLLARQISHSMNINYIYKNATDFQIKYVGQGERVVRELFEQASEKNPCLIIIDEMDVLLANREEISDSDKRLVTQFLVEMDGLKKRKNVIVIGITNRINVLDPAIRREGRFSLEIEFGLPDFSTRWEILVKKTEDLPTRNVNLALIADRTPGYSGADLEGVIRQATLNSLKRVFEEFKEIFDYLKENKKEFPPLLIETFQINREDFSKALSEISPTLLKEEFIQRPDVLFSEIEGLETVKKEITLNLELINNCSLNYFKGFRPIKGILLTGPPGTGKTMLAKAIAGEFHYGFINIDGSQLNSKYVGDSEKKIAEIFKKARAAKPCIIFLDEVETLMPSRDSSDTNSGHYNRIVNQFLVQMDGLIDSEGVIVIGATNRIDVIDSALLRPGRFDKIIKIGLPEKKAISSIINKNLKDIKTDPECNYYLNEFLPTYFYENQYSGAQVTFFIREIIMQSFIKCKGEKINFSLSKEVIQFVLNRIKSRRKVDQKAEKELF